MITKRKLESGLKLASTCFTYNYRTDGSAIREGAVMKKWIIAAIFAPLAFAVPAFAGVDVGVPTGTSVGSVVGGVVGIEVSTGVGIALPLGIGGMAAIAGLSLIIGVQLARRRRKKK